MKARDFRAAAVKGAVRIRGKVRVMWRDGEFRAFHKDGTITCFKGTRPERVKGFIGLYRADTGAGTVDIEIKCMTCGGHLSVARLNGDTLWATAERNNEQSTMVNGRGAGAGSAAASS